MTQSLIEQYDVELQKQNFADLVALLVNERLFGKENPSEVREIVKVGGWYVSPADQDYLDATRIADTVITRMQRGSIV